MIAIMQRADLKANVLEEEVSRLKAIVESASRDRFQPGMPVVFGEYEDNDGVVSFVPPKSLPNIPTLLDTVKMLSRRLEALRGGKEEKNVP